MYKIKNKSNVTLSIKFILSQNIFSKINIYLSHLFVGKSAKNIIFHLNS